MKLKKSMKERTCSECDRDINKGDLYGKKIVGIPIKQPSWAIDSRPQEEIPEWAWSTVYFKQSSAWCESCANK